MNILVSGHSGFIGQAIDRWFNVTAIPRLNSIEAYSEFFQAHKPDEIIHLAAYGNHYDQKDVRQTVEANIMNTYHILEALKDFSYKRFYNVSSSSVLLSHQTWYSITKACAEKFAMFYPNVVNIRPYSVYGPGEAAHRFIPTVIRHLKSGECMKLDEFAVHDWIYVDDFIDALFDGKTEIGTGIATQNFTVVQFLEDISGLKLKYIPAHLRDYDNDNWKCPEPVNYRYNLYEGLKLVYDELK